MDELTKIRQLRPEETLPSAGDLDQVRARFLAETSTQSDSVKQPFLRRRGWLIAASVVAAGVAAATVTIMPVLTSSPASTADAATVLRQAVAAVRALPDITPRPDQFFYIKDNDGESWYSIDGTHDGYTVRRWGQFDYPGCRDGRQVRLKGNQPFDTIACTPIPAFLPNLPTTTAGMTAYVEQQGGAGGLNGLAKQIFQLLTSDYVRPASRAALYSVAANLPGVTVVPRTTDGVGRPGVGIRWPDSDGSATMIFDTHSHELLGGYTLTKAGVRGDEVLYALGIVDHVGQRP